MENIGYTITLKAEINSQLWIVYGEKEEGVTKSVTWAYDPVRNSYYFGHYFAEKEQGRKDYYERIEEYAKVERSIKC